MAPAEFEVLVDDISCCADLYSFPLVRAVLGDSWHPGGLALTRAAAMPMELSSQHHLLDIASGVGTSTVMLAQVHKCQVTGVDLNGDALREAWGTARRLRLTALVNFVRADATWLPFGSSQFDVALCECASNLFSDRAAALAEMARVLRPGGHLLLSDVTFTPTELPGFLDHPLVQLLCLPLDLSPQHLSDAIENAGLRVVEMKNHSQTITELLDKLGSFLGLPAKATGAPAFKPVPGDLSAALQGARRLIAEGSLGYWGYTARKEK